MSNGSALGMLLVALMLVHPEAASPPTESPSQRGEALEVSGVFVSSSGSWSSPDGAGRRVVLRYYKDRAEAAVGVRVLLQGRPCAHSLGAWQLRLLLDGQRAGEPCVACDCLFTTAIGPGAHTLTARVEDGNDATVVQRQVLLRMVREGQSQHHCGADFEPDEAPRAAALLSEYAALHRRIVDPDDTSIPKRFLVVRSSHGLSNTQIEEVTGLLMAIVTRRALILDFSNDTYTGQRPVMEYDWPLDIWMESMSAFVPEGGEAEEMPRIPNEEYGKYGELLACADWNDALPSQFYIANTLFGYPTAYLNPHHADWIHAHFGPYVFPLLHKFLHRPSRAVRAIAEPTVHLLANTSCSVGLQIRWHHLRAYLDTWGYNHPQRTVSKFVKCASDLCPLDESTIIFVATDFKYIRDVVQELVPSQLRLSAIESSRNLARSCGADGLQPCPAWQSSTANEGEAERAVDGIRSGVWEDQSCTHTWDDLSGKGTSDPTWMVDMEREHQVVALRLWQRVDCCPERLEGVDVYVGNQPPAPHMPLADALAQSVLCASQVHVRAGDSQVVWCGEQPGSGAGGAGGVLVGRYVIVVLPGPSKILTICEAEVYGPSHLYWAAREGRFPRVTFLEPDDEVVTGATVMDAGDHETALADQVSSAA